jgi:hypothetical protein
MSKPSCLVEPVDYGGHDQRKNQANSQREEKSLDAPLAGLALNALCGQECDVGHAVMLTVQDFVARFL